MKKLCNLDADSSPRNHLDYYSLISLEILNNNDNVLTYNYGTRINIWQTCVLGLLKQCFIPQNHPFCS